MKKTLVALAALAATASFAQSSVTLYGRVDLGSASTKTTAVSAANVSTVTKNTSLAGNQQGLTTSRLGVRGTEDLGGGLTAGFVMETSMQPDEAALFGNTRLGNLSLTGGFGRVVIGTYDNAMDTVRGYNQAVYSVPGGDFLSNMFNPNADGTPGTTFGTFGGNAVPLGLRQRSSNSIAYAGASGPFTFGIGTINESNTTTVAGTQTAQVKGSGFMAGLGYANGPLAANFAIGSAKTSTQSAAGTVAATNPPACIVGGVAAACPATAAKALSTVKRNDWAFAVSYDLGFAKPYFTYETASTKVDGTTGKLSGNGFVLGSTFPMGALAPFVAISRGSAKDNLGAATEDKAKLSGFQVGARYSLSKRTTAYAAFGNDKICDNTPGRSCTMSSKRSGYALGLRHDF